jgi:phage-related protein
LATTISHGLSVEPPLPLEFSSQKWDIELWLARCRKARSRSTGWARPKRDFLGFPEPAKDEMGNALGVAQFGDKHPSAKPWKGQGSGVFEVVEDHDGNTYRAVYTVRFKEVVYVLRAFQKKPPKGSRRRVDIGLVERQLKVAQQDYEARYGKAKR